jgi:ATP-binding cassette, subfamily C, bacterial CydC
MNPWLRLLALLRPSWRRLLLGVFLSLLALGANLGLLALSSWFITTMAVAGALGLAIDYTLPAAAIRALALARAGGRYAERLVNHDTTLRILAGLRTWFFQRLVPLAPARLQREASGDLLSRIRADVDTLDDFYVRGVVPALVAVLGIIGTAVLLCRWDPWLAVIDFCGLVTAGAALPLFIRARAEAPGREKVLLSATLRAAVVEQAQGMAELTVLGALDDHAARLVADSRALGACQERLASQQGAGDAGIVALSSLATWTAALVLAPRVAGGALPGPDFAMLTVLVLASFEAIMPLPAVIQRAGEMATAARRLFELIDLPPAAREPEMAGPAGPLPASPAMGIRVNGLRFRYAADRPRVYDGLSLEIPAGAITAIVGPTGAGKSTLVSLLLRFWEYEGGSIELTFPGRPPVDLATLPGDQARSLFSVMPQSPHLFHASIRDNLLVAWPGEEDPGDGTLQAALEAAGLADLLASLPDGLSTMVGELGRELSVGEARRVALARALLKEAPVYLLDEPTEGLDEAGAEALLRLVTGRLRGKTLVMITHRERDCAIAQRVLRMAIDT